MTTLKQKYSSVTKKSLLGVAIFSWAAAFTMLYVHYISQLHRVPPDNAFIEKLKSANHVQSEFAAPKQTFRLFQKTGLRLAALNAIGMEPREVRSIATGSPVSMFGMLSFFGYGEIIWMDQWTNFPTKLPPTSLPGQIVVPRRAAVRAALDAIKASGGCLIKAGKDHYLIAKVTEKEKCEAAIRALGWLDGNPPPWVKETAAQLSKPETDASTNRLSEKNQASLPTGSLH